MIGILGGTFDPIHYGHLRTALDVQQALGLEQVRFIPLRDPPHRDKPRLAAGERLALLREGVRGQAGFVVDDRELHREGPSYTLDTLASLRQELGSSSSLCLLLGQDAFLGFPEWHRPREILESAHLVVMRRPHTPPPQRPDLEALMVGREVQDPARLRQAPGGLLFWVQVTQLAISATRIRGMLAQGLSPRFLLPDAVLQRIWQHGLYR